MHKTHPEREGQGERPPAKPGWPDFSVPALAGGGTGEPSGGAPSHQAGRFVTSPPGCQAPLDHLSFPPVGVRGLRGQTTSRCPERAACLNLCRKWTAPSPLRPTQTPAHTTLGLGTGYQHRFPPEPAAPLSHTIWSPPFSGEGEGTLVKGKGESRLKLLTGNRPPSSRGDLSLQPVATQDI